jgi:uncharacterized protein (TIGR02246 family)
MNKHVAATVLFVLGIAFSVSVLAADTGSAVAQAQVRQAIDRGNARWIEGWEKGDAAMVAAIFTDDAVLLTGNGKMLKGRRQIQERQSALMQSIGPGVKVAVTTSDVWVDGDTAYETGKYRYDYTENGKPAMFDGRYATEWRRQPDGTWKLAVDMVIPKD